MVPAFFGSSELKKWKGKSLNIIGQVVAEASASVVRAPQNAHLDEVDNAKAEEAQANTKEG